jgi:hypothetical protein
MRTPGLEVPPERLSGPNPERHRSAAAALAHDECQLLAEVDILDG